MLNVGDYVLIRPDLHLSKRYKINLNGSGKMDVYAGKIAQITNIERRGETRLRPYQYEVVNLKGHYKIEDWVWSDDMFISLGTKNELNETTAFELLVTQRIDDVTYVELMKIIEGGEVGGTSV